ncbi:MAG TPA: DUF1449 family protein [Fimbriimonadaceae bacterium]|nr:DUF1449 family protein [Fimbriimonadaceae bacterium]HRJ34256.1 DUF1449 family protein [Fimbriimonadaceae bacterium]
MTTFEFLFASQNVAFAVTLGLFLVLGVVEIIMVLTGGQIDGGVDGVDAEPDAIVADSAEGEPGLDVLGWLHFGKVPALILILMGLLGYTLLGYTIQWCGLKLAGGMLAPFWAGLLALPGGILAMRGFGGLVRNVLMKNETSAIPMDALVGRIATITLGEAKVGQPSQAKCRDEQGTTHYVLVEPLAEGEVLGHGQEVILVERRGPLFKVVDVETSLAELMERPQS